MDRLFGHIGQQTCSNKRCFVILFFVVCCIAWERINSNAIAKTKNSTTMNRQAKSDRNQNEHEHGLDDEYEQEWRSSGAILETKINVVE